MKGMGRIGSVLFGSIWVFGWLGACFFFDYVLIKSVSERTWAMTYPRIEATVRSGEIEKKVEDSTTIQTPILHLEYEVAGTRFEQKASGPRSFGETSAKPQAYLEAHPPGSRLQVRYSPSDPRTIYQRVGITGNDLMEVFFLLPWHVIGFVVAAAVYARPDKEGEKSPSGLKVLKRENGQELRVRLPEWSPRLIAGLAFTGYGFLAYVTVLILGRGDAPIWLVLSMFALVVLLTRDVYRRRQRRSDSGLYDLVVDLAHQSLTLPATYGRKQPLTIPFAQIQEIHTESEDRGDESVSMVYMVRVCWNDNDEGELVATAAEWPTRLRADRLSKWLNQKIPGIRAPGRARSGNSKPKSRAVKRSRS